MEQVHQDEFRAEISFSKEELGVLIAGFAQRQSPSCSIAFTGYDLAKRLQEAFTALEEVEVSPLAKIIAEKGGLDEQSFSSIPKPSRMVTLQSGLDVPFYANPDGGAVWNGSFDENMPGPSGYTYGSVIVNGIEVAGYVCHASGIFNAADASQYALVGQEPPMSLEERAERAGVSGGF